MSVFINFMISYKDKVTNKQFHEIIRAAATVDCFVRFMPAGNSNDVTVALIMKFHDQVDTDREIIFTISSNPYDLTSHYLYDREMLDLGGASTDSRVEQLADVLEKFLLQIGGADQFLLVCSEGYDTPENFAVSEIAADQAAEHFTAIFLATSIRAEIPSLVLQGRWIE